MFMHWVPEVVLSVKGYNSNDQTKSPPSRIFQSVGRDRANKQIINMNMLDADKGNDYTSVSDMVKIHGR